MTPHPDMVGARWYDHDIFIVRASNLSAGDAAALDCTVDTIRAQLEADAGLGAIRIASPLDPGGAEKAAIMLVFVTPGLCGAGPWQDEIRRFWDDIGQKRRTPDQFLVCELRPITPEQWSSMPWSATIRREMSRSLFNPSTKMPFSDTERLRRHVWLTSNDLAERLRSLRANQDAAARVQTPAPVPGKVRQVYLMEHNGRPDLWDKTRSALAAPPGLTIFPTKIDQAASLAERRALRNRRRQILDNCDALLLLRGEAEDDIDLLSSDAIADLSEVGQKPSLCIDWAGQPAPLWPDAFRPETIVAAVDIDWVAVVKSRLADGEKQP